MIVEYLSYIGIGALAGFFAGLFGTGGGVIIVPLLIVVFVEQLGFAPALSTYLAVATAMGVIMITALFSAFSHSRLQNINWRLARGMGGVVAVGSLIGVSIATIAPAVAIKCLLFLLIGYNSVKSLALARGGAKKTAPAPAAYDDAARRAEDAILLPSVAPVACAVGALSSIVGVGGGAIIVPYLSRRGVFVRRAIGTSAFIGFPLALVAVASYIAVGWQQPGLPPHAVGYLYLPALACVALVGSCAAYLGARATNVLSAKTLHRAFGVILALVALRLLVTILETL